MTNKVKSKQSDRRRSLNGNLKHRANMIADPANVDDGKRPHLSEMLNGRHTAGSVTWLAFRPFDIPTRVKHCRYGLLYIDNFDCYYHP